MFAVDTNLLIWGVRGAVDSSGRNLTERSQALFSDLRARKITVMVPSVVLAEYLRGQGSDKQSRAREVFGRNYFIAPFDARAAMIAAELWDASNPHAIKEEHEVEGPSMRADYKIVATAIAHGATRIYANDGQFKAIAGGKILVDDVPLLPVPGESGDSVEETEGTAPRRDKQLHLGEQDGLQADGSGADPESPTHPGAEYADEDSEA